MKLAFYSILALSWLALSAKADDMVNPPLGITQVQISTKNMDMPANDLVYQGSPQFPTQQEAYRLKTDRHVDLSLLEPKKSDVWFGVNTSADESKDQALAINSGDSTNFLGKLGSSTGNFKFVVQTQKDTNKVYTLQISRTLHAYLLRKELLRRLGYNIPAIKYLGRVKVQFPDSDTRDQVLEQLIPKATTGASSRWCYMQASVVKKEKDALCAVIPAGESLRNENEVLFQDLTATDSTPLIYNVAWAAPINTATLSLDTPSRSLRALAVAYLLVNTPESINQFTWSDGRVDSGYIKFVLPEVANFNCTLDDAKWIAGKIAALQPKDFEAIVAGGYYPPSVSRLLVEKLKSRRNALLALLGVQHTDLAFNVHVGGVDGLVDGRLTAKDWPQYASNFAFGEQESPLQDLQYYFYSLVETNVFANLVTKFNQQLPSIDVSTAAQNHFYQLQQQGLRQFLETGKQQQITFGTWRAPVLNGGVNINRSIVFGTYMGTSQLVQLADTYGYNLNAGLFIGTQGLPSNQLLSAMISGSLGIAYTHLKPVTDLKSAFHQPMKQIYVPGLIHKVNAEFQSLSDTQSAGNQQETEIAEDMKKLKDYLDVGDSLIITQSINGSQSVSGTVGDFSTPIVPQLQVSVGLNEVVLSRLHVFRKDEATFLVFKDNGEVVGPSLSATFLVGYPVSFPVMTLTASRVSGSAHTAISNVNLSTDIPHNPDFFKSAEGIKNALATGSMETLNAVEKPTILDVQFTDKETSFRFFHWAHRSLKTTGHVQVTGSDGGKAHFLDLTAGKQSGHSYQALANDVATYLIQKLTNGGTESLSTPVAPNPGQTFLGSSHTRQTELQARTDDGITGASVQLLYKWEGWKMQAADAVKLVGDLSKQYGVKLYDDNFLQDTRDIEMYELSLTMTVYQAGLQKLLSPDPAVWKAIQDKYNAALNCSSATKIDCNRLRTLQVYMNKYKTGKLDADHTLALMMDALSLAEQTLSFQDLQALMGGTSNFYLTSKLSGFREGSETMSQPIQASHSIGQQDSVYPDGVLSYIQNALGIDDGEFKQQWLRDEL